MTPRRPDKVGLVALIAGEWLSGLGRGLLLVAAPWWAVERSDQPVVGAVLAIAIVIGWVLGRAPAPGFVRALRPRTMSWIADCSVALAVLLVLMVDMPLVLEVLFALAVAPPLAALQRHAMAGRPERVDRVAADAHVEPAPVGRWLLVAARWSSVVGLLLAVAALTMASDTAALWATFGLFFHAGEFVFVAVPRGSPAERA